MFIGKYMSKLTSFFLLYTVQKMVKDQSANSPPCSAVVTLTKEDRWLLEISADVLKQDVLKRLLTGSL